MRLPDPGWIADSLGCGGDNRCSISWTIPFDVQPVPSGYIRFVSFDRSLEADAAPIKDGRFQLSCPSWREAGRNSGNEDQSRQIGLEWESRQAKNMCPFLTEDARFSVAGRHQEEDPTTDSNS